MSESYCPDRGDVVWFSCLPHSGHELAGDRPALVISPKAYNQKTGIGQINFKGQSLVNMSASEMRKIRGNKIAMIFQEPMTSLNPVFTIGDQIHQFVDHILS